MHIHRLLQRFQRTFSKRGKLHGAAAAAARLCKLNKSRLAPRCAKIQPRWRAPRSGTELQLLTNRNTRQSREGTAALRTASLTAAAPARRPQCPQQHLGTAPPSRSALPRLSAPPGPPPLERAPRGRFSPAGPPPGPARSRTYPAVGLRRGPPAAPLAAVPAPQPQPRRSSCQRPPGPGSSFPMDGAAGRARPRCRCRYRRWEGGGPRGRPAAQLRARSETKGRKEAGREGRRERPAPPAPSRGEVPRALRRPLAHARPPRDAEPGGGRRRAGAGAAEGAARGERHRPPDPAPRRA